MWWHLFFHRYIYIHIYCNTSYENEIVKEAKPRLEICHFLAMDLQNAVTTWQHFPHVWPFLRPILCSPADFDHKGPVIWIFNVFFVAFQNNLLNKRSNCRWFKTVMTLVCCHSNVCLRVFFSAIRLTNKTNVLLRITCKHAELMVSMYLCERDLPAL